MAQQHNPKRRRHNIPLLRNDEQGRTKKGAICVVDAFKRIASNDGKAPLFLAINELTTQ